MQSSEDTLELTYPNANNATALQQRSLHLATDKLLRLPTHDLYQYSHTAQLRYYHHYPVQEECKPSDTPGEHPDLFDNKHYRGLPKTLHHRQNAITTTEIRAIDKQTIDHFNPGTRIQVFYLTKAAPVTETVTDTHPNRIITKRKNAKIIHDIRDNNWFNTAYLPSENLGTLIYPAKTPTALFEIQATQTLHSTHTPFYDHR